jgi:carbamate kinase
VRIVVALGGNALAQQGGPPVDEGVVAAAAGALAPIAAEHEVVVTHGNGPQVGLLAAADPAAGLDVLDAETEGMLGYLLVRELGNVLPGREVVGVLTRVEVAGTDPAFERPTKPIGRWYPAAEADRLRARGWHLTVHAGQVRRVVASPIPVSVMETAAIERLLASGAVVVAAGGGGIPVVRRDDGTHMGVDAVVDKDRASAILAYGLHADALLLLTDVDGVYDHWGTPAPQRLRTIDATQAASLDLDEGSMGPKVEAALAFARGGGAPQGRFAAIGALGDAAAVLHGDAGTRALSSAAG